MFASDYREVELSEVSERRGVPPIFGSERTLVRAYVGRFCFDFGLATACLKTTVSITEGKPMQSPRPWEENGAAFDTRWCISRIEHVRMRSGSVTQLIPS